MEQQTLSQRAEAAVSFWRELAPGYKRLGVGLLLAVMLSVALSYYLNRPQLVPLGSFDPKVAGAVTAKLTSLKVAYQPGPDGQTLLVNKADLYTARLAVAQSGVSSDGTTGYELFDNQQFGATELQQQVNLQRAIEGELTRALLRLDQVQQAQVRLAIPQRSAFVRNQSTPTAAVLLQLRPGAKLSTQEVQGLLHFIASAVPGLTPDGVTLIDSHGRSLGKTEDLGTDAVDSTKGRLQVEQAMEARLLSLLEPIFGSGNVVAKVSLELDTGKHTLDTKTFTTPTTGPQILSQETTHQITTPGAITGSGTATTPVTTPAPPQYQAVLPSTTPGSDNTHTITNYQYGEQHQTDITGPGAVKNVTAGVVINAAGGLSAAEIQQVQQTVAASLGAAAANVTVSSMPFRQPSALDVFKQPAPTAGVPAWVLAAAGAVVLLIGLIIWLLVRRRSQPEPALNTWEVPATEPGAPVPAAPSGSAVGKNQADAISGATAAVKAAVADAAAANNQSPGNAALENFVPGDEKDPEKAEALMAGLLGEDNPLLANPKAKEQVEKAVRKRPQDAAAILSSWLQERRR